MGKEERTGDEGGAMGLLIALGGMILPCTCGLEPKFCPGAIAAHSHLRSVRPGEISWVCPIGLARGRT